MAKGKNAAALFEVINRGRQENRKQAVTTTPSWWFKGRPTNGHAASPATDSEAQPYLKVDRDRHLISLRATFATGIIALFAIVVIVGVAFIWGKHMGKGATDASTGADEQATYAAGGPASGTGTPAITAQPLIPPGAANGSRAADAPIIQPDAPIALTPGGSSARQSEPPVAQPAPPQAAPAPVPTAVTGEREVGLNYAIIQSYPPGMVEAANEARDLLMKHGIPCTVEPAPTGIVPKGWVSVIGTTGFSRVSTSDFKNYIRKIEGVSAKMAGSKFKKLEPFGYKWK